MTLALLCAVAQGAWAQTTVTTDQELRSAITGGASIKLGADIDLSNSTLSIESNTTVAINLNGHTLDRKLTKRGESGGQVITVRKGAKLNLSNGTLKGGWGGNGGGIANEGGTVELNNVTISGNTADDRGGGISNSGTLTMKDCTITGNTSNDRTAPEGGGGLFNANGATATLTNVSITSNAAKVKGGGGICNYGTMTLDGCTVTGNSCQMNGGGIWTAAAATLNMQGKTTVTGNTTANDATNNLFLKTNAVITVTGSLAGSDIGFNMESMTGTFTSGYGTHNSGVDPATIFTPDLPLSITVSLVNNEAQSSLQNNIQYIERSWDATNKKVVNTNKTLTRLIDYGTKPAEGDYKEVKAVDGWFALGGFNNDIHEYYVVRGNVSHTTLNVLGKNVHLILCDGAKLTLSGGILCYGDKKLYIHCQSYGPSMGELYIASGYKDEAAGIGSDWANDTKGQRTAGDLDIHGGKLTVKGGAKAAGIGGGFRQQAGNITIYGGDIKAYGGEGTTFYNGGAGIGGSSHGGGHLVIYDGKVYAEAYKDQPGIGAGQFVFNDLSATHYQFENPIIHDAGHVDASESITPAVSIVDIHGGQVEAHGGKNAAGIGGGYLSNGVILNIHGGDVKAYGGDDAAGIGGGWDGNGGLTIIKGGTVKAYGDGNGAGIGSGSERAEDSNKNGGTLEVSGGHVEAYGGVDAAGIGGGEDVDGGVVKIFGGYVYAEGNDYGPGIGGGQGGDGADVTITGGTVIAKAGRQAPPEEETENRAIGPGEGCDDYGKLTIGNRMMVQAGYDGENYERIFMAGERVNACWYRTSARIEPCTHGSLTYTVSGTGNNDTHTAHCKYCTTVFEAEPHTFADGVCTVCGVESTTTTHAVRTYLPSKVDEAYDGETYGCQTTRMADGTTFTMPTTPTTVPGLEFKGWEVSHVASDTYKSAYTATDGGTILEAGEEYTISGDVSFIARYQALDITLIDNASNGEAISTHDGMTAHTVTLSGRTLYKDGKWNTLCLPFSLASLTGTPLEGAMLMELDTVAGTYGHATGYEDGTLYLNFKTAAGIEAGKPYLIKWTGGRDITNPVFSNVTISNKPTWVVNADGFCSFVGTYSLRDYTEEGRAILFLGGNNTLYHPSDDMAIGACRAVLQANLRMGDVNDDGVVNVVDVTLLVDYILGNYDERFITKSADITGDGIISVTDVTALVNLILHGGNILNVVVNGADGLNFGGMGSGPARVSRK